MMKHLLVAAALSVGTGLAVAQEAVPSKPLAAPGQESAPKVAQPKAAKVNVYDEKADAKVQISTALAKAKKNNRRVLIQWGANWCGWCKLLHETCTTDPDIKKELLYEYDVVHIDVGQFDKNIELATDYKADLKKGGLPYLTILDGDGKAIINQETGPLEAKSEGAHGHDKAKVLGFLKQYQADYPKAEDVLSQGMAAAKKDHKEVFLHFGAPWCGWCHRLEDWMAKPEVSSIMGKDFVDVKIDQDRTTGAKEVFEKYNKKPGGIPWFCVLDMDGKAICTSDGAKGNIGFPGSPEEIEHFIGMMNKAKKNMSAADVAALQASLEKDNKKDTAH